MQIKLIPSQKNEEYDIEMRHPEISVSISSDDMTLTDTINILIKPALIAWGFSSDLVEGHFDK